MKNAIEVTTEPVRLDHRAGIQAEFGRIQDVQQLSGLKRGTIYNLLAAGKIRGCVLRVKGRVSGCRVIDLESVRQYIRAQMNQQNNYSDSSTGFKSLKAEQSRVSCATAAASVE